MDFLQITEDGDGNDLVMVAHDRHSKSSSKGTGGGSNFAMCDGSARYLRYWECLSPINLWAVKDEWRTNFASMKP